MHKTICTSYIWTGSSPELGLVLVCPPLVFFLWPAGQESNQPTSFPHQQLSWQHSHNGTPLTHNTAGWVGQNCKTTQKTVRSHIILINGLTRTKEEGNPRISIYVELELEAEGAGIKA